MTCVVRQLPVTGFLTDRPHGNMPEKDSKSPEREQKGTFPIRTNPSKEDLEVAHDLVRQSQGLINGQPRVNDVSPSPSYEDDASSSKRTPPPSHLRQLSPRSPSLEQNQGESLDSFAPVIPQSDITPSGQVCR